MQMHSMARLVAVLLAVATTWALPQMYGAMLRVNDQDEQLGATDTPDEVENLKGGDDEFVPSLCVSRQGQRLHVQFGLELPSEAPILQSLSTDAEALSGRELVEQLIGEVWVTQSPQLSYTSPPSYGLEFQEPRIVRSTSAGARILIDAEEITRVEARLCASGFSASTPTTSVFGCSRRLTTVQSV